MVQQLGLQEPEVDYEEIDDTTTVAEQVAKKGDYERNQQWLTAIHVGVYSVSMVATSITNSASHYKRLGVAGAIALGIAIAGVVEGFYFTLRHGLRTVYQGSQRKVAKVCYHLIQITMILNVALLCAWIIGNEPPRILLDWNHWSIVVHWALALFGVAWVSDTDWIVADRMSQLKAATDVEAIRKAASAGTAIVIAAAKFRGYLEAIKQAGKILRGKEHGDEQSMPSVP